MEEGANGVVAFVRAAGRPCSEGEILQALFSPSSPNVDLQQSLGALVQTNQLETAVVTFGEGDEQRLYWLRDQVGALAQPEEVELAAMRGRLQELDEQIAQHSGKETAYDKEIVAHMERVHDYNELKDVAQALMGRLATIEGLLTRDLYKRYGLDLED